MNIFVLDYDHTTCAQYHCDKHIVKMPLETAQMLSSVYARYNEEGPYLPVHGKHPCTLWAGNTVENYKWLWKLGNALLKEYTYRYERTHKCAEVMALLRCPPKQLTARGFTKFAQAMPDEYKHTDVVTAYRNYYRGAKRNLAVWSKREPPAFMEEVNAN